MYLNKEMSTFMNNLNHDKALFYYVKLFFNNRSNNDINNNENILLNNICD